MLSYLRRDLRPLCAPQGASAALPRPVLIESSFIHLPPFWLIFYPVLRQLRAPQRASAALAPPVFLELEPEPADTTTGRVR